ncbi:MAG: AAA family ATPase, partial [Pseudomonadota bacterium]
LTRLQETMAQQGLHRPDSRVLSSAMLPLSPNAPQRVLLLIVGAVAGFFLSLVVVFIREAVDKKIWSAEQIEKITGVPMIGGLPFVRGGTIDREIRGGSGTQSSLHRAMESLITTLLMSRIGKQPHVLVIASARPGEGKTTVAMALARLMSERGRKTLLVDADIRKAKLSKNLGYRKAGVLAAFSGEADIAETIDHHEALGVDVLGGKPSTTHRGTVQEASTIERFFSTLRSSYDVVVVDTSPLRAVADALPICKAADTVLMLSSWKETRTEDLRAGMRMLSKVDIDPAGYVMTKMPESELAHSAYDGY